MRLIAAKLFTSIKLTSFLFVLDKIIIPENLAVRLANSTEVSAETFYVDIIKQIQKLQVEAQRSMPKDQPKMNRSEFNSFLHLKALELQSETPADKKLEKRMNKKKKYQDDEDFNVDMESSGDKVVTTMFTTQPPDSSTDLNDTTIIFDQEQDD